MESDSITAVKGQQPSSEHQEMQLIQILFLYMYKKINWKLMLHDLLHTGNGLNLTVIIIVYYCCSYQSEKTIAYVT